GDGHIAATLRRRDVLPGARHVVEGVGVQGVVAVQGHQPFAARVAHAVVEGGLFVLVGLPHIANGKAGLLLPALDQRPGLVGGAVVHHHPFEVLEGLLAQRMVDARQRVRAVEGGCDNGKEMAPVDHTKKSSWSWSHDSHKEKPRTAGPWFSLMLNCMKTKRSGALDLFQHLEYALGRAHEKALESLAQAPALEGVAAR